MVYIYTRVRVQLIPTRNTNPRRATMCCFGTYEAAMFHGVDMMTPNVEQEISVTRG